MNAVATYLYCDHCGREEVHEIRYAGEVMTTITCARCGTSLGAARLAVNQYMRDLSSRVAHKPGRVVREAVHDPRAFLAHLPGSLATKPARMAAELSQVSRLEHHPWVDRVRPLLRRLGG